MPTSSTTTTTSSAAAPELASPERAAAIDELPTEPGEPKPPPPLEPSSTSSTSSDGFTIDVADLERATANLDPNEMREMLAMSVGGLSAWAASIWGKRWEMQEREARAIARPLVRIIETEIDVTNPWHALYLALGAYALPRVLSSIVESRKAAPTPASSPASS